MPQISNICNVLFVIGNGFDLNLGMKTRYTDMYEGYINSLSSGENIKRFKSILMNDGENEYINWSDFEMGMANHAKYFSNENELIECVRDFKKYLTRYLNQENEKINKIIDRADNNNFAREMYRSQHDFYKKLIPNASYAIEQVIRKRRLDIHYLVFNYTSSLETLLYKQKIYAKDSPSAPALFPPIHIHGNLNNDVVLGIDNEKQLDHINYPITNRTNRAFIKPLFNQQFDNNRYIQAQNVINNSDIICVYGFSFGQTDEMWVKLIADWLVADKAHHIVIFQYDKNDYSTFGADEIMDVEDEKKMHFMHRFKFVDENGNILQTRANIMERIHIPIGYNIFNFDFTPNITSRPLENGILTV